MTDMNINKKYPYIINVSENYLDITCKNLLTKKFKFAIISVETRLLWKV